MTELSGGEARALVRSLARGTAISRGARHIHVGHARWLAAQDELLREIAEDGHAEARFVRGAYGAGKSHFLAVVQDRARDADWLTCHVECKADGVQIDRFETLLPQLMRKLTAKEMVVEEDRAPRDPLLHVLRRWLASRKKQARIRETDIARPFDADRRLWGVLQADLAETALHPDFIRAVLAFARADLAGDSDTVAAVLRWLRTGERVRLARVYLVPPGASSQGEVSLSPINAGNARDIMRAVLWLVRAAGYAGLLLCIDEVEELAKLGSRKRQDQALQALREFVDHCGGEGDFRRLCLYLAATPDMFDGPDWFPRYDALATRIQPIGERLNWRAPVVDLDRTPLDESELANVASNIQNVYEVAHGVTEPQEAVAALVREVAQSTYRIAKPRLLARAVIDELQRYQDSEGEEGPPAREAIEAAARALAAESE